MNFPEINKLISSKIKKNELVEIFRGGIDEVSALGNVMAVSSSLLCFENFVDFKFDGIKIIRNKDVTDIILCDKNNSLNFMNMICNEENIFSKHQTILDIKNWNNVFEYFMKERIPVSVECAFEDALDYYFGYIEQINSNIVKMQCFDGEGKMFVDLVSVNLNFVSALSYDDRYTTLMAKYAG